MKLTTSVECFEANEHQRTHEANQSMHNVHSKIPRMKENEGPNGVQNEKKPCLRYDGFAQLTVMVFIVFEKMRKLASPYVGGKRRILARHLRRADDDIFLTK